MLKKRIHFCLFLITFLVLSFKIKAQEAQFSQFYAAGLYLNPALAGAEKDVQFSSNYRMQFRNVTLPYTTNQFSFIYPFVSHGIRNSHKGGLGASFYNDRAGDGNFKTQGFYGTFAYNIPLSYNGIHFVSFGIQAGLVQRTIDFSNLQWGSQFNPYVGFDPTAVINESQIVNNKLYPDINAGIILSLNGLKNFEKKPYTAHVGVAGYHLNTPNESMIDGKESFVPRLLKAHAGLEYKLSKKFHLAPNAIFLYQNGLYQLNGGMYLTWKAFEHSGSMFSRTDLILGSFYRLNDSFIFMVGMSNDVFTLGLSYDLNSRTLRYFSNGQGSYEISLSIRKISSHKIDRFSTPRI